MPSVDLAFLGGFQVKVDGVALGSFPTAKTGALLAYLALEPDRLHDRRVLSGLLWPEMSDRQAQDNLRNTLARLRRALDAAAPGTAEQLLVVNRHTIGFAAGGADCDALALPAALWDVSAHDHAALADCPTCLARLDAAVRRYRGELLPGLSLRDAVAFEEWLLQRREHLHVQALLALGLLSQAALAQGSLDRTLDLAFRQIQLDPFREDAHRLAMRALADQGFPERAVAQYEALRVLLREELGVEPSEATTALLRGISVGGLEGSTPDAPLVLNPSPDWREAPLVGAFFGRAPEVAALSASLTGRHCQLLGLVGLGGVGKSTLAAHVAHAVSGSFDVVLWHSLLNAPAPGLLMDRIAQRLAGPSAPTQPGELDAVLERLLELLRQRRCLLVLDNLESVLDPRAPDGYRATFEDYRQLLRWVAEREHASCLLFTSREWPRGIARLERSGHRVCSLELSGLDTEAALALLRARGLAPDETTGELLAQRYSGNPLALDLVAHTIRNFYAGDAAAFLADGAADVEDLRQVLDQQVDRLSPIQLDILYWLAVSRQSFSPSELRTRLLGPVSQEELLDALRGLDRQSLLQRSGGGFMLQNVVTEYLTDRLVHQISREIDEQAPDMLHRVALLQAQAPDHVRAAQVVQVLEPIVGRLGAERGRAGVAATCRRLLEALRRGSPRAPGYAAGNVLNLLLHLGADVDGLDFSGLCVWEASLQGRTLPGVDFRGADLSRSAFTDAFGYVWSLAYSPDGQLLVAGTSDGQVHIWRTDTLQPVAAWQAHPQPIYCLTFSPDGALLASGTAGGRVGLWDLTEVSAAVAATAFRPVASAVLPSGAAGLAAGVDERQAQARLLHILEGHGGAVQRIAFAPESGATGTRFMATASDDRTLRIWDLDAAVTTRVLSGHDDFVLALAYSPDGRYLASGGRDNTVRLWEPGTGRALGVYADHSGWVTSLAFCRVPSEDERPARLVLVSGSEDGSLRLRQLADAPGSNLENGVEIRTAHEGGVQTVACSHDGRLLASGGNDRAVRLWDLDSGRERQVFRGHGNWVRAVAFSPDDGTLASGSWDNSVRLWDTRAGQPIATLQGHSRAVFGLAFSPSGRWLASATADHVVRLWDVATGSIARTLVGHRDWVWRVAFQPAGDDDPDRCLLASASMDHTMRLWNLPGGQEVQWSRHDHHAGLQALAFSPDGSLLATGDLDGHLLVQSLEAPGQMSARRARLDQTIAGQWCLSAAFSPDGATLASAWADHIIRLWDLRAGGPPRRLEGHGSGVQEVAYSPDGRLLASASWDRTVRLWDADTGEPLRVLDGHANIVQGVAFSPDSQTLASSSYDHTVRLWEVATGQEKRVLRGHDNWVFFVAYHPDGRLLASAGQDQSIRLWDSSNGECQAIWPIPGPYEGMQIAGATGLTPAQRAALVALGAVDAPEPTPRGA